jgi:hypothetical protein
MFGAVQKLAYLLIFGAAICLPSSFRRRWINQALSPAIKLPIQRAARTIKRLIHQNPRLGTIIKA